MKKLISEVLNIILGGLALSLVVTVAASLLRIIVALAFGIQVANFAVIVLIVGIFVTLLSMLFFDDVL